MKCPHCGEQRQVEYDKATGRWFCATCGRIWGGRHAA